MTATRVIAYAPNGARMGPLPTPQDVQVGYPLNDVGALAFAYPPNAPRADVLGQPLELAVECSWDQGVTWQEPDSSRFLYLRDGRDPIKTGDAFTVECSAYIQRLAKALVGFNNLDADGNRTFTNYTPGKILRTLIIEAQNRGALTGLTYDWTDAADSSGTAWPTTVSYSYEAGKTLLSILQEFVDAGLVDFRTQGRNVQMFVAGTTMATDRTLGANPVSLRFGRDLTEAPFRRTWENIADTALVKGDGTANLTRTNAAAIKPWGRQETFVTASGVTDAGTLQTLADASLALTQKERLEWTFGLDFHLAPFLPFRDYKPGDWVWAVTNGSPERVRIRQVTLTRGDDGTAAGNVVLNDRFVEADVATQRSIQRLTSGATLGGTGKTPTGAGNDILQPAVPTGLAADSLAYLDRNVPSAQVTLAWTAVTTNRDGSAITDLAGYDVWRRSNPTDSPTGQWSQVAQVDDAATSWSDSPYAPGTRWDFKIRARDNVGNLSGFSDPVTVTMAQDVTAPPAPSQPILLTRNGVLEARWDGLDVNGDPMPGDLDLIQVHRSQVSGFTPEATDTDTAVASMSSAGTVLVSASFNPGDTWYVRFLAIDHSGNVSDPSPQASASIVGPAEPEAPTPPASTTTPVMRPLGVGSIIIVWPAVPDADLYRVYIDTAAIPDVPDPATLRGETTDLNMAVANLPNGNVLVAGTDYHVRVIPVNEAGAGPIGPEAVGQTRQATSGDISPAYVYTGGVDAGQVNTGNLTALLALLGGLTVGDLAGKHIVLNPNDGFLMIDAQGTKIVEFPLTLDGMNRFEGDLTAHGFTSLGGLRLQGTDNEISINSSLELASGMSKPVTTPRWASGYYTRVGNDYNSLVFNGFGLDWNGTSYLRCPDGDNSSTLSLKKMSTAGVVTSQTLTQAAADQFFLQVFGVVQIGTNYYVLYRRMPVLFGTDPDQSFRVGVFRTSDGVQTSSWVVSLVSSVPGWSWTAYHDAANNAPTLGKDEAGNLLVAQIRNSDRKLVVKRLTVAGAAVETVTSAEAVTTNALDSMTAIQRNAFDFGAVRYSYKVSQRGTVEFMTTAGVLIPADTFDHPEPGQTAYFDGGGVVWNGTRFVSSFATDEHTLALHSTAKTDDTYWAGFTWYDSNVAGTGRHETDLSPIQKVVRRKRYGMSWSLSKGSSMPAGGGVDDPDTGRAYLGGPAAAYPGATGLLLQTAKTVSAASDYYYFLDTPDSGAAAPTVNTFPLSGSPAVITSETGGFHVHGDGSGDWPAFRTSIVTPLSSRMDTNDAKAATLADRLAYLVEGNAVGGSDHNVPSATTFTYFTYSTSRAPAWLTVDTTNGWISTSQAGWYRIKARHTFGSNATGSLRQIQVIDTSGTIMSNTNTPPMAAGGTTCELEVIVNLAAGAPFRVGVAQNSGSTLNVYTGAAWGNFVTVERLDA